MAVKTSWSAGDVLAAADLTDTFAAKAALAGATYTGTHDFSGATVTGIPSGLAYVTSATFTTSSAVNVNSCFTSTYAHYRIVTQLKGSTGASLLLRLRSSGSDDSTSNYDRGAANLGSTYSQQTGTNQSSFQIGYSRANMQAYVHDMFGPQLADRTQILGLGYDEVNLGTFVASGSLKTSTQYDGFTIYPDSGTLTGVIRIYGYKNS